VSGDSGIKWVMAPEAGAAVAAAMTAVDRTTRELGFVGRLCVFSIMRKGLSSLISVVSRNRFGFEYLISLTPAHVSGHRARREGGQWPYSRGFRRCRHTPLRPRTRHVCLIFSGVSMWDVGHAFLEKRCRNLTITTLWATPY